MLNLYRHAGFVIALAAMLSIAVPTSAKNDVPFEGYAKVVITGMAVLGDGIHLTAIGTGQATHLGLFTREEAIVIHWDLTIEGTVTFKAPNDDLLIADITGVANAIPPTAAIGYYTFNGGSGRFKDASGETPFTVAAADGYFAATFDGSIDY